MLGNATPPHSLSGGSGPSTPTGSGPGAVGSAGLSAGQPGQQPVGSISSAFPLPPGQYFSLYSEENLARGRAPEPPKPVTDGSFAMFGVQMTNDDAIIRPLEAQSIRRLYPREYDHKKELRKMNASILANFLDLLDVLVKCPDTPKREEKCADINMLFIQMHHLINEMRPHQARETIRVTMQSQWRQRRDIVTRLNKQIDRVNDLVVNCVNGIPEAADSKAGLEEMLKIREMRNTLLMNGHDDLSDELLNMIELDSIMCNLVDEIQA